MIVRTRSAQREESDAFRVAVLGDQVPGYAKHSAIVPAVSHAAHALGRVAKVEWIGSVAAERQRNTLAGRYDAFVVAPQDARYCETIPGLLMAIRVVRQSGRPLIATCGGFQLSVAEITGSLEGFDTASCAASRGNGHRFEGVRTVTLAPGSRASAAYGANVVREEFACSRVLVPSAAAALREAGFAVTGHGPDADPAVIELCGHPFYMGVSFVPQWRSARADPHPLFVAWANAAVP